MRGVLSLRILLIRRGSDVYSTTTTQSNLSKFIKKYITKEPYTPPIKEKITQKESEENNSKKKSLFLLD